MRVAWSPDGSALLAVVNGTLRLGDDVLGGPDVLDARWREDGAIIAIDRHNRCQLYRGREAIHEPREYHPIELAAAWLTDHHEYLAIATNEQIFVANVGGRVRWRFDRHKHDLLHVEPRKTAAISADGKVIAIGYETRSYANDQWRRMEGRGWLAVSTTSDHWLDRSWAAATRTAPPMPLALDARGKRLAFAVPDAGPCYGALRLDTDERYVKTHAGGARAVALDDRGILAAYAYPRGAAERKVRVDYLDPRIMPTAQIAITETSWIDPDADDIVALAFDRASRKIACLDASGAIDVVPVP